MADTAVEGRWPGVAGQTPTADVVVCHHVVNNVLELAAFVAALTLYALRRVMVVVELTAAHPKAWMTPNWHAVGGVSHREEPSADDALEVLAAIAGPSLGDGGRGPADDRRMRS